MATPQPDRPADSAPRRLVFVAAPWFEPATWQVVERDDMRQHWLTTADGTRRRVHPDNSGNWIASRGEAVIYTRDGESFRPVDDPITLPDPDHERAILTIAAARLREGRPLGIEDEARVHLARRRLAAWRDLEAAA